MGTFGERLRREREMRRVSLDEISAATKIGTRLLRALEEEQFDLLPGGIFNKGFVRAYAKYLGIDEEGAVADYLEAHQGNDPDPRVIAAQNTSDYAARNDRSPAHTGRGSFPFVPVLILIVLVVGASGGWRMYQEHRKQVAAKSLAAETNVPATEGQANGAALPSTGADAKPPESASESNPGDTSATERAKPKGEDGVSEKAHGSVVPAKTVVPQSQSSPPPAPVAQSASAPADDSAPGAAKPEESAGAPFEVSVKAKDRAWVSIKSDGIIKVRGIIKPPDIKTIRANDQVVLWTGNAGDVEVSFNGKDVPLTGGQNDERVLVFNSHGLLPNQTQSQ